MAVPEQVRHVVSHVLHILLSEKSMNSLLLGHSARQNEPIKYRGIVQLVHVVAVPEQVVQVASQALQIRLSETSPNSCEEAQLELQTLVATLPQSGSGHWVTQV